MKTPAISVVMSVYNGGSQLREAIDSILAQTCQDFELIIINDGSTDNSAGIVRSFADRRIKLITQKNAGLVASLNRGIKQAKAPLIARQDADDVSEPSRLATQLAFFEDNPDICIVGSSMSVMNDDGNILHEHRVLLQDAELKQELLIRSPFAHGSVMFRTAAFAAASGYLQEEWPAEDYGLWLRMAPCGSFANLDEPLYVYRENPHGISARNQKLQQEAMLAVRDKAWQHAKGLTPRSINVSVYADLEMGQLRVGRIAQNLFSGTRFALAHGKPRAAITQSRLLLSSKTLRRKYARLVAVKLGVKRA